jgi:hypothetical protein
MANATSLLRSSRSSLKRIKPIVQSCCMSSLRDCSISFLTMASMDDVTEPLTCHRLKSYGGSSRRAPAHDQRATALTHSSSTKMRPCEPPPRFPRRSKQADACGTSSGQGAHYAHHKRMWVASGRKQSCTEALRTACLSVDFTCTNDPPDRR